MADKALCSIPDCSKPRICRGLCRHHYNYAYKHDRSLYAKKRPLNKDLICSVDGCGKPVRNTGMCNPHYLLWFRHKRTDLKIAPKGAAVEFCRAAAATKTDDCIIWPYAVCDGYGIVHAPNGKPNPPPINSHRYVCILAHGEPNGLHALHTCHNSKCVNPGHLYWGTNEQNIQDKLDAGRQPKGDRIAQCILTEEQAREAKYFDCSGFRSKFAAAQYLGQKFGVTPHTIKNIWQGGSWRWV